MDVCKENITLCNLNLNIRFNEGTEYSFLSLYYQEFSDLYCRKHDSIHTVEAYDRQGKMFSRVDYFMFYCQDFSDTSLYRLTLGI